MTMFARRLAARAGLPVALLVASACGAQREVAPKPGGSAVAVFVHGGGWTSGAPRMGERIEGFFAARHVPVRAIDYPKRPAAPLAEMIRSVTRQLSAAGGSGPLTVVGHSVGAHLAAAAALGVGAPPVRCLILLDGIGYDLGGLLAGAPGLQSRLGLSSAQAAPFSPAVLAATARQRPAIYLGAGGDARDTAGQARAFAETLRRARYDVTLRIFPTARHADFLRDFADPGSAIAQSVSAFLAAHPRCTAAD